jgi:hypothetical protein
MGLSPNNALHSDGRRVARPIVERERYMAAIVMADGPFRERATILLAWIESGQATASILLASIYQPQ